MAVLDLTIVALALPSIRQELGFSTGDAQWILSGYALSFGGLLLVMGRAGDLYGRRRLFMIGLTTFAATSMLAGLAQEPWILVAARLLQGIGGAALVPASLALLAATFSEGEERNQAMGIYGAIAGVGFVFGMVMGGVITEYLGWRWVFFVNGPVALAVLFFIPSAVRESRDRAQPRSLDLLGAVLATLGLAAFIMTIGEAPNRGWLSPITIAMAALGIALLWGFAIVERHADAPIMPLGMFRKRGVMIPNAAVALLSMIGASQLYVLTLYFQDVLGRTPLHAGFLFMPMTLASVVASPLAGQLTSRVGAKRTAALGFAVVGVGLAMVTSAMFQGDGLAVVLSGMVLAEAGFMTASVPLTIAAIGGVGKNERGLGSGILSTSRELGNAFGWAMVAAVLSATATVAADTPAPPGELLASLRWGLSLAVLLATLALVLVLTCMSRDARGARAADTRAHDVLVP